ncbi:MAG TPA: hypothetical protein VJH90_02700 [archaeon]|nr:hypothetical protein [archaeon]
MKGLHWGLIVGLVVVVILLLVGSGIAGDIAKFTYTDYTDIKPGGGEGGGIIGGGGLPPSSDILVAERPLSESDNKIYDSEIGFSIADKIAEHFINRGNSQYKNEQCISGYDICLVGRESREFYDYKHGYKKDDDIVECDALNEICVTKQLANMKVGGASSPNLCTGFLKNDIVVKFGNNKCLASGSDPCPALCPNSDMIAKWGVWKDAGAGTGGIIDKLEEGIEPLQSTPYFYDIYYQPSKNEYGVRFYKTGGEQPTTDGAVAVSAAVKAFHRGFDGNYWNRRGSPYVFDIFNKRAPSDDINIAGYRHPEARRVATIIFTPSAPYPLLSELLKEFKVNTNHQDAGGEDQTYKLSFDYKTCTNEDNCASRLGSFKAGEAYAILADLGSASKSDVHICYDGMEGAWERELVSVHNGWGINRITGGIVYGGSKDHPAIGTCYKDIVHIISNLDPNGLTKSSSDGVKYRIIINRWQIAWGDTYRGDSGSYVGTDISGNPIYYSFKPTAPIYRDYSIQIIEEKI